MCMWNFTWYMIKMQFFYYLCQLKNPNFKLNTVVTYITCHFLSCSGCHNISEQGDGKAAQLALFTGNANRFILVPYCHLLPSASLPAASPSGLFHTRIYPSTSIGRLSIFIFILYSVLNSVLLIICVKNAPSSLLLCFPTSSLAFVLLLVSSDSCIFKLHWPFFSHKCRNWFYEAFLIYYICINVCLLLDCHLP